MQDKDVPAPEFETTPKLEEAPAPTSEQEVTAPAGSETTPVTTSPRKKNKKLIIAGIIAAGLVLLGGTGAAAYNLWYQNPDKVLSDAMINIMQAKSVTYTGSMNVTQKDRSLINADPFSLTIDGKNGRTSGEVNVKVTFSLNGKEHKLSGSGMYDKDGNIYLKINDVRKLVDSFNTEGVPLPQAYSDILTKIDSKWIRISADDLKEFSEDYAKTQECTSTALQKFEKDKAAAKEITELYKKNSFIVVKEKLASQNGSLGYVVDSDEAKAKSFAKGLSNTTLFKELKKCDESLAIDQDDVSSSVDSKSSTSRVEVWVSRWSHELTKLQVTDNSEDSTTKFVLEPVFNQPVEFSAPKSFIKLSELKADIENAAGAYGESITGEDDAETLELGTGTSI